MNREFLNEGICAPIVWENPLRQTVPILYSIAIFSYASELVFRSPTPRIFQESLKGVFIPERDQGIG